MLAGFFLALLTTHGVRRGHALFRGLKPWEEYRQLDIMFEPSLRALILLQKHAIKVVGCSGMHHGVFAESVVADPVRHITQDLCFTYTLM